MDIRPEIMGSIVMAYAAAAIIFLGFVFVAPLYCWLNLRKIRKNQEKFMDYLSCRVETAMKDRQDLIGLVAKCAKDVVRAAEALEKVGRDNTSVVLSYPTTCPTCGQNIEAEGAILGQNVICPYCQTKFKFMG